MNEVVVTGSAVVTSLGLNTDEFATRMLRGESGIFPLDSLIQNENFPIKCAGLLPDGVYPPLHLNQLREEVEAPLRILIDQTLMQSKTWEPIDGIIFGTNAGLPKLADIISFNEDPASFKSEHLSSDYGLEFILKLLAPHGQPDLNNENKIIYANGCVTGLSAISFAMKRIQLGLNKRVMVICDESRIRPEDFFKYDVVGALSRDNYKNASRPFSKSRNGFVRGEGAGLVIIEKRKPAEHRSTQILGSLLGYGQYSDAWRLTESRPDLIGMSSAIARALACAQLKPEQIDFISAHGISTPKSDVLETAAIKQVFGKQAYRVPVSSLKSQIGHLNYACSIVEVISCLIMLEHQKIAPTINYEEPDPLCDLNYVPNTGIDAELNYILKNSFGFGGANACLLIGRS